MVPYSAVKGFLEDTVGANSIPSIVKGAGLPLPGAVIDARVGGAILPFDVGLKAGGLKFATGDAHVKYFLFGADVRYCVVEQLLAVPKVSVGVGINRMTGNVTVDGVVSGMEIDTTGLGITGASSSVDVSKGDFYMDWKTTVLDFKVQASWDLLIVKPSFGLGASYGMSQIEAGLDSRLTVDGTTTTIPQSAIDALHNQYGLDVSGSGIGYTKKANALAYRLFGGIGINILLVKLDFGLLYNINGGNWGATLGARVQL
jgi:hypothetical protein